MPSKNTGIIAVRMNNKDIERLSKLAKSRDTTIGMIIKGLVKCQFEGKVDFESCGDPKCRN